MERCGIIKYYNSFDRTEGVLKERFDDFIVQEIVNGEICAEAPLLDFEKIAEAQKTVECLLQIRLQDNVFKLYEAIIANESITEELEYRNNQIIGKYLCEDKEERTRIHLLLKHHPLIKTDSNNSEIIFRLSTTNTYSFTLMKTNRDTVNIATVIEKQLSSRVSFAGNKDKRAVTYQKFCCKTDFIKLYELKIFNCEIFNIKEAMQPALEIWITTSLQSEYVDARRR